MADAAKKREGEAPPAQEQPLTKKQKEEEEEAAANAGTPAAMDSDTGSEQAGGPSGAAGDEERRWLVAPPERKAVRVGDNFQATLPQLSPPPVAATPAATEANGNGTRAGEFHSGPVDLDEDGLGTGARMYQ